MLVCLFSVFSAFAYLVKPTTIFVLFALGLFLLFSKSKLNIILARKRSFKITFRNYQFHIKQSFIIFILCIVLFVPFASASKGLIAFWDAFHLTDQSISIKATKIPFKSIGNHICKGLTNYESDDYDSPFLYRGGWTGMCDYKEGLFKLFYSYLTQRSLVEYIKFFLNKDIFYMSDASFTPFIEGDQSRAMQNSWIHNGDLSKEIRDNVVLSDNINYLKNYTLWFVEFLIFAYLIVIVRRRKIETFPHFLLVILGLFTLYQTIFEGRSRYWLQILPVLIILAVNTLDLRLFKLKKIGNNSGK